MNSGPVPITPVIFPPGRAILAAMPTATGSDIELETMGMVVVAAFKASTMKVPSA
jgi:hypothetical protein